MAFQFTTYNEKALHAALKTWYASPTDQFEQPVGRYVIDIVQPQQLVEIQTRSFASLKTKLHELVKTHRVRLVHPIAQEKWVVKLAADLVTQESRRKSPKRGSVVNLFAELVSFPKLINHPNFSLEVLLIREEEQRRHEPGRSWRRAGWVTHERYLLGVVEQRIFHTAADLVELLPSSLVQPFTSTELAKALRCPGRLAQQMSYCLRTMGAIEEVGKRGRAKLYQCISNQKTRKELPG